VEREFILTSPNRLGVAHLSCRSLNNPDRVKGLYRILYCTKVSKVDKLKFSEGKIT
jgi:hypothetical protein